MRPEHGEPVERPAESGDRPGQDVRADRAGDGVPEALAERSEAVPEELDGRALEPTGEVSMLPPEEASKVAAEIRAVAEMRGEDSDVVELAELQKTGPLPIIAQPVDDDTLTADELR